MKVRGHLHLPYAAGLRDELLALNTPGPNEIHRSAVTGNAVALAYADAIDGLLSRLSCDKSTVRAIGAHGQTVRHQPIGEAHERYTVQLLNGAVLAERAGATQEHRTRPVQPRLARGSSGQPVGSQRGCTGHVGRVERSGEPCEGRGLHECGAGTAARPRAPSSRGPEAPVTSTRLPGSRAQRS